MKEYRGVFGETEYEFTVERSRFIAFVARTAGEEEARAYLSRVKEKHPFATHVCYAYVADREGNLQRFSDDGEPQGTAGMPILGVLKAQGLCETTAAVVRYFGGIKLGAGGLVRAYSSAAAEAVRRADLRLFAPCAELEAEVNYPEVGALLRFLEGRALAPVSSDYAEKAHFLIAVKEGEAEAFQSDLLDALSGRVRLRPHASYFYPFPLAEDKKE